MKKGSYRGGPGKCKAGEEVFSALAYHAAPLALAPQPPTPSQAEVLSLGLLWLCLAYRLDPGHLLNRGPGGATCMILRQQDQMC